jgi:hypothetical protein
MGTCRPRLLPDFEQSRPVEAALNYGFARASPLAMARCVTEGSPEFSVSEATICRFRSSVPFEYRLRNRKGSLFESNMGLCRKRMAAVVLPQRRSGLLPARGGKDTCGFVSWMMQLIFVASLKPALYPVQNVRRTLASSSLESLLLVLGLRLIQR